MGKSMNICRINAFCLTFVIITKRKHTQITNELIVAMDSIDRLYAEWRSLLPMKKEDLWRLDRKFMLEFNYNSNHLEGNTLTYGQTELLLLFGKVEEGAEMKDLEEMKAHNVALKMIQAEASSRERPLTETFIRGLHRTLLREDYTKYGTENGLPTSVVIHAGQYKKRPNSVKTVTGERFEYASPEETPALMAGLVAWYRSAEEAGELSPICLASVLHYRFIRIHPFDDGNGRIARLLVNYVLARHNYPMVIVRSKDKDAYLTALNHADVAVGAEPFAGASAEVWQIEPFVSYMEQCLEQALNVCIKAAKGDPIDEEDDFDKELAIIERRLKKKNTEVILVSKEARMDVYNLFHRDFSRQLIADLRPLDRVFAERTISYCMFQQKDNNFWDNDKFFSLEEYPQGLTLNLPKDILEILENAHAIIFQICFSRIRGASNKKVHPLKVDAGVKFFSHHYTFQGKKYSYGSFPTSTEQKNFRSAIKDAVLEHLQKL